MSVPLQLISLNIERSLHLPRIIPFFEKEQADVVCLQELYQRDIKRISEALRGAACLFAPMTRHTREMPPEIMGVGIFSRLPVRSSEVRCYNGNRDVIPELDQNDASS